MLPSRPIIGVAALLMLMSQASCVQSTHPLEDPEKCAFDKQLAGAWKQLGKDEVTYAIIGRPRDVKNRPDGLMVIHETTFNADQELRWIETPGYFFPVKMGESHYLQFLKLPESKKITQWDATEKRVYEFWKYQIADGRLTLWLLDKNAAIKAIEDGVLKGSVKNDKSITSPQVTLTEPSEGLRRCFATDRGKSLFPDKTKLAFERVK